MGTYLRSDGSDELVQHTQAFSRYSIIVISNCLVNLRRIRGDFHNNISKKSGRRMEGRIQEGPMFGHVGGTRSLGD